MLSVPDQRLAAALGCEVSWFHARSTVHLVSRSQKACELAACRRQQVVIRSTSLMHI